MRGAMGFLAEAVVREVRAEIVENWVLRAIGDEVEVEARREMADVDPSAGAVGFQIGILGNRRRHDDGGGED